MTAFKRDGRSRIDAKLTPVGRGTIGAALFDLGIYPAAIPSSDGRVHGEVHRMADAADVVAVLDEFEGFRPSEPDSSLYVRAETTVTFDDGREAQAWAYFYNAPLGGPSGSSRATISTPEGREADGIGPRLKGAAARW
jgi:gamma-glutamylcyclotransferase (GGCT)/AIG2-like uncharacterized protein YtfP